MQKRWMRGLMVVGVTILSLGALAGIVKTFFSLKGESRFDYVKTDEGYQIFKTSTQKYFVQEIFKNSQKQKYLFAAKENSSIFEDLDHVENSLQLSAFTDANGQAFSKKAWSLNEPATTAGVAFNDQNLLVLSYNMDAADVSYRAYDIGTGHLVISYQDMAQQRVAFPAPYIITVPNSSVAPRYVGLISSASAHDFDEPASTPPAGFQNTVLIKYGSLDNFINKWMIQTQAQTDFMSSVSKVEIVPFNNAPNSLLEAQSNLINLWDLDGAASASGIGGFAFRIHLALGDADIVVTIPIKNDKLDLSQALVPARAKIVVIK